MTDVQARESRCIRRVVNAGMSLKFALVKEGLDYASSTSDYHRLYRKIIKAKKKKKQKAGKHFVCLFSLACLFVCLIS